MRVSTARPAFDAEINVMGTINMLEAARQAGTRRFVYASTGGAIYGETDVVPTPEDTVIAPEAPYGQAKFAGEGYLGLWNRMHDLSTVCMRFGNVYGPRQDPLGEAGVIAIFCGKLETGGQPTVFGDGLQTRDYIFVEDVVRACMIAGDSDVTGSYNVGRGEEVSVLDLVEALRELGSELGSSAAAARSRRSSRRPAWARCSAPRSTRRARARCSASRPRSSCSTACAARCSSSRPSKPRRRPVGRTFASP